MPVDVFGRTDFARDSTRVISRGINMTQANGIFLRRDGENTAGSDIDLDLNKLINVADPTSDKDAANKEYVDSTSAGANKVSKSGDTMTGDLLFTVKEDSASSLLGCIQLPVGKAFVLAFGSLDNRFQFHNGYPLTLHTTNGLMVCVDNTDVCKIGSNVSVYRNIEMNHNKIIYLTEPTFPHEAVPKSYVDRKIRNMTYLSYEGYIPPLERAVSKTGFVSSTSSRRDSFNEGWHAFNSGTTRKWAPNGVGPGQWIQISCPTAVRIWKIRLTGGRGGTPRITSWKLGGGTLQNDTLDDIHTSDTTLGHRMQEFEIDSRSVYNIYRLTVLSAEPGNIGLSYFQIYRMEQLDNDG